jgi:hypothetical protein
MGDPRLFVLCCASHGAGGRSRVPRVHASQVSGHDARVRMVAHVVKTRGRGEGGDLRVYMVLVETGVRLETDK